MGSPQLLDGTLVLDSKRPKFVGVFRSSLVLVIRKENGQTPSEGRTRKKRTFADSMAFAISKAWLSFNPASSEACLAAIVCRRKHSSQRVEDEKARKGRGSTHAQLSFRRLESSLERSLLRDQLRDVGFVLSLELGLFGSVLLLVILRSLEFGSSDGVGESRSVSSLEFLDGRLVLLVSLMENLSDQVL